MSPFETSNPTIVGPESKNRAKVEEKEHKIVFILRKCVLKEDLNESFKKSIQYKQKGKKMNKTVEVMKVEMVTKEN